MTDCWPAGQFRAAGADGPETCPAAGRPEIELTGDTTDTLLVIGATLDVDGEGSRTSGQSVATLGTVNRSRDDAGAVICQAISQVWRHGSGRVDRGFTHTDPAHVGVRDRRRRGRVAAGEPRPGPDHASRRAADGCPHW